MAFSYSALKLYETCPTRYRLERILKLKPPMAEDRTAAERGNLLHTMCEQYLLKQLDELPTELYPMKKVLDQLREWGKVEPEKHLALDINMQPIAYDSEAAVFRGIIDTVEHYPAKRRLMLGDWKSGKVRDYSQQLQFYSTLSFPHYDVDQIDTCIRYIDLGKIEKGPSFKRDDFPQLWQAAMLRKDVLERDRVYAPNPSANCRYCPWSKQNGGPCKW